MKVRPSLLVVGCLFGLALEPPHLGKTPAEGDPRIVIPDLSPDLLAAHAGTTVRYRILVDRFGYPRHALVPDAPAELREALRAAALRCRFAPRQDGRNLKDWIELVFRIEPDGLRSLTPISLLAAPRGDPPVAEPPAPEPPPPTHPRVRSLTPPVLPHVDRLVHAGEQVRLQVNLDATGRLVQTWAVECPPSLEPTFLAAARAGRYRPRIVAGKPQACRFGLWFRITGQEVEFDPLGAEHQKERIPFIITPVIAVPVTEPKDGPSRP
jgi:hypothetical protein